jgi:hypothetical protein
MSYLPLSLSESLKRKSGNIAIFADGVRHYGVFSNFSACDKTKIHTN